MKVIAVYGGKSAEHDISIRSTFSILQNIYYDYYDVQLVYITKSGAWLKGPTIKEAPTKQEILYLDKKAESNYSAEEISPWEIKSTNSIVFPILHGPYGEDGAIQGLLEMMDMPYVGAGVVASATGMDKILTKYVIQQSEIPQVPFVPISKRLWKTGEETVVGQCEGSLIYPMFVKPANLGSSVGISKAEDREELILAVSKAFQHDRRVIVEQGIEAREIEVAVLGNDEVRTTLPGEIVKEVSFYDYDEKYLKNNVKLQVPATISSEVQEKAREFAKTAYILMDGAGLSRCDFFLTTNDELYLNEINTMPGFTDTSMYPLLWEQIGLSYGDLIEELIQLGLMRYKEKQEYSSVKK